MDSILIGFFNQFAARSVFFDESIASLAKFELLKGGVIVTLFYWAWFRVSQDSPERRTLLITLISTPLIVVVARFSQMYLPYRARPMHAEGLDFTLPFGVKETMLGGWSSFPSDHAVLFVALCTGILMTSRALGIFAMLYALVVIGLPRVYLGLHYPTDLLAGAILGGGLVLGAARTMSTLPITDRLNELTREYAGPFYALFFLATWQIATLFEGARSMASFMADALF